jgi:hypothetical protein
MKIQLKSQKILTDDVDVSTTNWAPARAELDQVVCKHQHSAANQIDLMTE